MSFLIIIKITCHNTTKLFQLHFRYVVIYIELYYIHIYRTISNYIYRTIILPVVLFACKTWSLTLREERKLRVFENMVLRRIFGPRRDEVTGGTEEIA